MHGKWSMALSYTISRIIQAIVDQVSHENAEWDRKFLEESFKKITDCTLLQVTGDGCRRICMTIFSSKTYG